MDDLLTVAQRWSRDNRIARQQFNQLAGETVSAVVSGDLNEFSRITERAAELAADAAVNREETRDAGAVDRGNRDAGSSESRSSGAEES